MSLLECNHLKHSADKFEWGSQLLLGKVAPSAGKQQHLHIRCDHAAMLYKASTSRHQQSGYRQANIPTLPRSLDASFLRATFPPPLTHYAITSPPSPEEPPTCSYVVSQLSRFGSASPLL